MPELPELSTIAHGSWAVFLDFDGTLIDIANHPNEVVVTADIAPRLRRLKSSLGGALAIVSGRSIRTLDTMLGIVDPDAAGCHGAEIRIDGVVRTLDTADSTISFIAERLVRWADAIPFAMVEVKTHSVAFHYRMHILDSKKALRIVSQVVAVHADRIRLIEGKQVIEIVPIGAGKGRAIASFLNHPAYAGRVPIFIGDDVTDEEGFQEVNRRGGISIRVGTTGKTAARFRAPNVAAAAAWLDGLSDLNWPPRILEMTK